MDHGAALPDEASVGWKSRKYWLLIALDRSDELVAALREWIQANDASAGTWELSLGYLLAEQGKLPEAIEIFEKLRAAGLLAGWSAGLLAG